MSSPPLTAAEIVEALVRLQHLRARLVEQEFHTMHALRKDTVVHGLVFWGDRAGAEGHLEVFGLEVKINPDKLHGYTLMSVGRALRIAD